jgi:hypothetical protein
MPICLQIRIRNPTVIRRHLNEKALLLLFSHKNLRFAAYDGDRIDLTSIAANMIYYLSSLTP